MNIPEFAFGNPAGLPSGSFGFQLHSSPRAKRSARIPLACPAVLSVFHYTEIMRIQPYTMDELHFAWCNRVYMRSRTHLRKPLPQLAILSTEILNELLKPYNIHVLDFNTDSIEFRLLLSLLPTESVSAAASKSKGRISKWLGEQNSSPIQNKSLARGYFAITTGQSVTDAVEAYLDTQSEHHGYADRVRPPVFVRIFEHTVEALNAIQTDHAVTLLRYHIVLATWFRRGVFDETSAEVIANDWTRIQGDLGFLLDKVSFVPDHVHIAVSLHPKNSPAEVVIALMNVAQNKMWNCFESEVITAGVDRLWQASAYVGSFGNLTSNAVSSYMNRWSGLRD